MRHVYGIEDLKKLLCGLLADNVTEMIFDNKKKQLTIDIDLSKPIGHKKTNSGHDALTPQNIYQ